MFCGDKFPKEENYFCQVPMVYIVLIISIVNLCISDINTCLWSSFVSGSVGYLLSSPSISKKKENDVISYDFRGLNCPYVYCDAAEVIPVGDIKAPLLRVIDVAGKFSDLIHGLYTTSQYVPVSKKEFNTVEIDIRDDTGRTVPFEFGKVVVTLHFRGSRNPYFLS